MRLAPLRLASLLAFLATPALSGEADVIEAAAEQTSPGMWTISATIRHGDTGWEHYADAFEVLAPNGDVLGLRTLYHPHVNEQPFTRSLSGVRIPPDINRIKVRAKDKTHGHGGAVVEIMLAR